jgi:hypothetical protein
MQPGTIDQLLCTFTRLAAVLQMTMQLAQMQGKAEQHAALAARLAVFRARVQAGENGTRLAIALNEFGTEYKSFIEVELGWRRV